MTGASRKPRQGLNYTTMPVSKTYPASPIRRCRATRAEVQRRRKRLFEIVSQMRPMTVRQVFYQATVRSLVEKSEAGYGKVQTDLVQMRRSGVLRYDWPTTPDGSASRGHSMALRKRCGKPPGCIGKRSGSMPARTS